jgi:acetoin utilization deacetylase AcuC-like enzyme
MALLSLIYDSACAAYEAPFHPESPVRVLATAGYLQAQRQDALWTQPVIASEVDLLRVHTPAHLRRLHQPRDFDADTPYYEGIETHARRAAGGALVAVDEALRGHAAFSLSRPPGHHATADRAMGFCYLNSIAIAARYALEHGCARVAIWDFDAHHGNGTEAVVANDGRIRFASVHQYPGYPGTGTSNFANVSNWPIPPMSDPDTHVRAVRDALEGLLAFDPELLLVSAGFDAFAGDPITQMTLERHHFEKFGTWLAGLRVPVAAVLEGGYSRELPVLVASFLNGWAPPANKVGCAG